MAIDAIATDFIPESPNLISSLNLAVAHLAKSGGESFLQLFIPLLNLGA